MYTKTRLSGLLWLGLAGVLLSGCGGNEPASPAPAATEPASTAAPQDQQPRNQVDAARQQLDQATAQAQDRLKKAMEEVDQTAR